MFKTLIAFIKLIRLPNLFIIAIAQYAMRFGVIYPMYSFINKQLILNFPDKITNPHILEFQMSEWSFFLLVLSTVMIAAGGYIINDYFDVNIDRINKPGNMVIDKGIKRRAAMAAHMIMTTVAVIIAIVVSYKLGLTRHGLIFVCSSIGLWFYNTEFKKQFLIGNVLIALFVGLVPFIVGLYELNLAANRYDVLAKAPFFVNFQKILSFITGFSVLAFLINLAREVIKDIEDMDGDEAYGCRTIPITLGLSAAKNFILFLLGVVIVMIGYIMKDQFSAGATLSFWYLLLLLEVPLLVCGYFVFKAIDPSEYKTPDLISKVIMFTGIGYTLVIYFSFIQ